MCEKIHAGHSYSLFVLIFTYSSTYRGKESCTYNTNSLYISRIFRSDIKKKKFVLVLRIDKFAVFFCFFVYIMQKQTIANSGVPV